MEIRKFLCQKISLPKGYLAMKYYSSATKTVATGGYFRDIALHYISSKPKLVFLPRDFLSFFSVRSVGSEI